MNKLEALRLISTAAQKPDAYAICVHRHGPIGTQECKTCGPGVKRLQLYRCSRFNKSVTFRVCALCAWAVPEEKALLLHHVQGYRDPGTQKITEQLAAAGWKVHTSRLDSKVPFWGIPPLVEKLGVRPKAVLRWEEHGGMFVNEEWRKACHWLYQNGIVPLQVDWAYFDHYRQLVFDPYESDGSTSVRRLWSSLPETPQWEKANPRIQHYRKYMADEWDVAGQLGPVPGTVPGYVLVYLQFSCALSTFGTKNYKDWVQAAKETIEIAGLQCVFKKARSGKVELPEDAVAFGEADGIPHLNTRLLRYAKHSVIITSSVSNEAVLQGLPVVACGRSWFSGLDVFHEAVSWSNIAVTPEVNETARARWINFWIKRQVCLDELRPRIESLIEEGVGIKNKKALFILGVGLGNHVMAVPAMKALSQLGSRPLDLASRGTPRGYFDLFAEQPWVGATAPRTTINGAGYDVVTGYALTNILQHVNSGARTLAPGHGGQWPHEVLRNATPARAAGYNGILPSTRLRAPYPKTTLPRAYVVVAMDCTDGGAWSRRRWPHWQQFARAWGTRLPLVFVGTIPCDWAQKYGLDLIGKTSAIEAAGIIEQADGCVSIDNGLSHLAGAMRTPGLALFGPTTSLSNGPWTGTITTLAADLPCRPCFCWPEWNKCEHMRCLSEIHPGRVVDVLERILERRGEPLESETIFEQVTARINVAQRIRAPAAQRRWELCEVWRLLAELRPQTVMEIGSLRGGWVYTIAPACDPAARFICLDVAENGSRKRVEQELRKEGHETTWLRGDSHKPETVVAVKRALGGSRLDVLHIDGDHSEHGVLQDWKDYGPLVRPGGYVLFHDADNPTEEVPRAFEKVRKSRPKNVIEVRLIVDPHGTPPLGVGIAQMR